MFEAAFTLPEQKGVLVLSNADIVFDRTLNLMRGLPCNKMNVLSVKGGPQHASKNIRDIYLRYTSMSRKNLSRSKPPGKICPGTFVPCLINTLACPGTRIFLVCAQTTIFL